MRLFPNFPDMRPIPFATAAIYVLLPLLCWAGIEKFARAQPWATYGEYWTEDNVPAGIPDAHWGHKDWKIDYAFLGASRTRVAVAEKVFADVLSKKLGRPVYARNFALGGQRQVFHWLGLRNLIERSPWKVKGTVFFIEAPMELPEFQLRSDMWAYPELPGVVVEHIRLRDLPGLWATNQPPEHTLDMTVRALLNDVRSFFGRAIVRGTLLAIARERVAEEIVRLYPASKRAEEKAADIRAEVGIRNDPDAVRAGEGLFFQWVINRYDEITRPWDDYEHAMLGEIVGLIHKAGGRVVFFDMPLHSYFTEVLRLRQRTADREKFRALMAKWDAIYVSPPYNYTDDFFPDVWHMSYTRGRQWTYKLAEEYLRMEPEGKRVR